MTQPKRLSAERLEELKYEHAAWLEKPDGFVSPGQLWDSKTILQLLSHIDALEAELDAERAQRKVGVEMRKELGKLCSKALIDVSFEEILILQVELANAHDQLAQSKAREARLVNALQKIDEPMKYHHWEEDPYTRAGCFQFVAHEALKADSDGVETMATIREAMIELETFEECNCDRVGDYVSLCGIHMVLHKLKEVFGEPS